MASRTAPTDSICLPEVPRRAFLATIAGGLLAAPLAAGAQQAGKVYRIGFLRNGPPPETFTEALRTGLRELGYVEGQNIRNEYALARSADELPDAAARLVSLKVDVLLASGTPPVPVARAATQAIPIVFVAPSILWRLGRSPASHGLAETSPVLPGSILS